MDTEFQAILNKLYSRSHQNSSFLTEETYIKAIESVFNMVVITDVDGIVEYANPAVERITGYMRDEVIGKKVGIWGGMMPKQYYKILWKTILNGESFNGELQNHRKNGDTYTAKIAISPIKKNNKVIGFVCTEEDITIEKKLQKEKEEFISLASHQLRTPLGAMKWGLELLSSSDPTIKKDIINLSFQNQLMIDLVNRLLIIMRIADSRLQVKKEAVKINDLIKTITSHFEVKLKSSGLVIKLQNPHKNLEVFIDPILIKEIIDNLLDNAIKYSKKRGVIILKIVKNQTQWSIVVEDNGIGISKKDLPLIINKFHRGSNTISIPGTGLGMYIVNTYTHILKGTLHIKSVLNKKTTITCTFPL